MREYSYEGLIKSEYFFIEDDTECIEDYLYRSLTNITPFDLLEEELQDINDYCVFLLENTELFINKLNVDVINIKNGKEKILHPCLGDISMACLWD